VNKYIIEVSTIWPNTSKKYSAIADSDEDLFMVAEELAYANFIDVNGPSLILKSLFPNVDEYTDEQIDIANSVETNNYHHFINLVIDDFHDDFEKYELVYKDE
jgi:hypothetical protein